MINSFKGKYFFLSNFYDAFIIYNGVPYNNNEAAFQAQKCIDIKDRRTFSELTPSKAKKKGRHVKLRDDWEDVKVGIMFEICWQKFVKHPMLYRKLKETYPQELIEGNDWNDKYWGVCNGEGENALGEILMCIRYYFLDHSSGMNLDKIKNMKPMTLEQIRKIRIEGEKKLEKKIIKKYKEIIDDHNAKLDYGDYENVWSYGTILNPLLLSLVTTFFVVLALYSDNQINNIIGFSVTVFIGSFVIYGLGYAVNWFMYEYNKERKSLQMKRSLLGLGVSLISLLIGALIFYNIYLSVR